jgi:hypothetical protein
MHIVRFVLKAVGTMFLGALGAGIANRLSPSLMGLK